METVPQPTRKDPWPRYLLVGVLALGVLWFAFLFLTQSREVVRLSNLVEQQKDKLQEQGDEIDRLDEALQAAAARKPPLPLVVAARRDPGGPGYVLTFKNYSDKVLRLLVEVSNAAGSQSKTFNMALQPDQATEIRRVDGWMLAAGDRITVSNAEYEGQTVEVK